MQERTTIQILKTTREELSKLKIHPKQPYDEIIQNLIRKEAEICK